MTPTILEAQQFARGELSQSVSPDVDVQMLLCHVLDCNPVKLMTSPEIALSPPQWQQFAELVFRRKQGEPVAYLTGLRGFWSLDLEVSEATLIPRPDTELLVSLVLPKLVAGMRVVDLGTGTGAIALSIAMERADIEVIATDYSEQAIQLAKRNAHKHQLRHVHCVQASWLTGFQVQSFDVIVSNPPYIATDDPHLQKGDVRFEPLSALVAGKDGLDDIRLIVKQAQTRLKPGGWLLVEHGHDQGLAVQQLFKQAGFSQVACYKDFGRNDRAVMGQLTV